jgi:hypothetical protein
MLIIDLRRRMMLRRGLIRRHHGASVLLLLRLLDGWPCLRLLRRRGSGRWGCAVVVWLGLL